MKYSEQLNDNRWKLKREKILAHADYRCQACGVEQVSLQVHHSYYRDSLMAWEYPDGSLIALCADCHGRVIHGIESRSDFELGQKKRGGKPSKISMIMQLDFARFTPRMMFDGEKKGLNATAMELMRFCEEQGLDISYPTAKRVVSELVRRGLLIKGEEGFYHSG